MNKPGAEQDNNVQAKHGDLDRDNPKAQEEDTDTKAYGAGVNT